MDNKNPNRMKLPLIVAFITFICLSQVNAAYMVCYYDSTSFLRAGTAKMTLQDIEPALQFCNYLVYGYAAIDNSTFNLSPLHPAFDAEHYRVITSLKLRYPHVRILLSVGGDRDIETLEKCESSKYLLLLENPSHRQNFVDSAVRMLKQYNFDGLDLAWQFPKQPPKKVQGSFKKAWTKFKGWFTGPAVVDDRVEDHKEQFTALVRELNGAFKQNAFILTLTMLPHVDSLSYVNTFVMTANVEFINLVTFDFKTPERDPKVADYSASLYDMYDRDQRYNVNYQVELWLNDSVISSKINIGIPTFGRSWIMTEDSGITGYPPVEQTNGSAPGGPQTQIPGILSWPEICEKINLNKQEFKGGEIPLRKVGDPTHRFGTYGYYAVDNEEGDGAPGLWVSYEEPATAGIKANYVRSKGLGGVALFDISFDDFRGTCAGEKYPILRSVKYKL